MEHNDKLVHYFVTHYHDSESDLFDFLVSSDFIFSVDRGAELSFQEYSKRKDNMQKHVKFTFGTPESDDGINYTASVELVVKQIGQPDARGTGICEMLVVKNLMQRIDIIYDAATKENTSFQTAIQKLRDVEQDIAAA